MNGAEVRKERFVVWQVEEKKFSVLSLDSTSGRPRQYCVTYNGYRWLCNCPHFLKNSEDVNFACKHIVAVMQTIGQQTEVEKRNQISKKERESLEERIKKLERKIESLEDDVLYAINPANYL